MDFLGKTLGNYRIDRLLGEGGMGAVYQAYDLALEREVAIKLIHPHFARKPEFRERFLQEARLMARLNHPGIVQVYILGKENDLFYLPMEFINGGNLRQLLDGLIQQRKWIPLNEAVLMMRQLCRTVQYAHQHGVLHRDLKPANLMIKPEPSDGLPFRIVITDLGLAKLLQGLGMTQEGTYLGTPAYMSPEQASGQNTDPRSDVYSLGILLYELAVGRLPFPIRTITEAVRYHTREMPPSPCSVRPELPGSLEQVIMNALEKDPNRRYPSAVAMADILAETLIATANVAEIVTQHDSSLVTEYDRSVLGPPAAKAASLMTVFEQGSIQPRGVSVFAGQSIAPDPNTRIQVVYRGTPARMFPLRAGTVIIGRGPQNDIPLSDPKASQRHTQITWDGLEYHIMDLNSTNGTYLGITKLLPGIPEVWRQNQNLRIGDTWLRLIPASTSLVADRGSNISGIRSIAGKSMYTSIGAGLVGVSVTPQQSSVTPGESVTVSVSLLNQSPNVDHFTTSLSGISGSWVSSLPPSVQLMPGEQKETAFTILVPRNPKGRAGQHRLILKVTSQNDPGQFVEVKLPLTVAAYSQFKAEIQPQRLQRGQTGRLTISNLGNAQETFGIQFSDPAGELSFDPFQAQSQVGAGETNLVLFHPKLNQPRLFGSEKLHSFSAQVKSSNEEAHSIHADMVSHGRIPIWVLPIMVLFCLLCIGAILPVLPKIPSLVVGRSPVSIIPLLTVTSGIQSMQNQTPLPQTQQGQQTETNQALTSANQAQQTRTDLAVQQTMTGQALTQNSQPLPLQTNQAQMLMVIKAGTGSGVVTSSAVGINCGSDCQEFYASNTPVTLNATSDIGSTFTGWSGGGCSGAGTCTVNMNAAQAVTATFNVSSQILTTTTTLSTIPSPLTAAQTNISFSGQVSANPPVPDGQTIQLKLRAGGCGSDGFSPIVTTTTTNGIGSFSSSFTAPAAAGTYGLQANFIQRVNIGNNNWQPSNSICQAISVNNPQQNQTIIITTHAPGTAVFNSTFQVAAASSSNLPVTITTTGVCSVSNSGSGSATITMTSGTGQCIVHYNQAGGANTSAAAEVTDTTNAQKADQSITITQHAPLSRKTGETFTVAAVTDSNLGVNITTSEDCGGSGIGSATITAHLNPGSDGTCNVNYTQNGDANFNPALGKSEVTSVFPLRPRPTDLAP
jgi:serine/threonine protein kinase